MFYLEIAKDLNIVSDHKDLVSIIACAYGKWQLKYCLRPLKDAKTLRKELKDNVLLQLRQ